MSRNIGIISTDVITKIQAVLWDEYATCKWKGNILIYDYNIFPGYFILTQVSNIQLFWNHHLHSRFSAIRENDNILDFSCVRLANNTLVSGPPKVEIQNAYKVNDFLRFQPLILYKQW